MSNVKNINAARLFGNVVENPVRAEDNFSQRSVCAPRVGWADEGKGCQNENVIQNAIPDSFCRLWIIPGDVRADVTKVFNRLVGPNYFEVHAVAHDNSKSLTSS